jgi:hypothetical protein
VGTNLGGLAAYDNSWVRSGIGKLFLVPYPQPAGEVGKVTITAGGTAYVDKMPVTFSGGSPTRQAQGFSNVTGGIIQSVTITDPGAGYTSAPTCVPTGAGSGATLTPALGLASGPLKWLLPSPSPVFADFVEGFLQRFYSDPTQCKVLDPLLSPWAMLTADGFKPKFKQEMVDVDPNDGPKFNLAGQDLLISAEFSFFDMNADHWADALSTPAGNMISIAAATGKAGRTRMGIGAERILNKYSALYRMPSPKFSGEFDHLLIPRCTVTVDADTQLAKSKEINVKLSLSAQAEPSLASPVNGEYCTAIWDYATAAGL